MRNYTVLALATSVLAVTGWVPLEAARAAGVCRRMHGANCS